MGRRGRRIFLFACICICVTKGICSRWWWLQCDGGRGTTAIGNLILHCFQMCKEGLDQTCGKPFLLLTTCNQKLTSGKKMPTQHHIHDHPNSNGLTYSQKTRYNNNNTKKEINNPRKQDQTFQRINLFTNAFSPCGCVHRIRQLKNKNEEKGRHLTWFWLE